MRRSTRLARRLVVAATLSAVSVLSTVAAVLGVTTGGGFPS